jgi:hypothetical protein
MANQEFLQKNAVEFTNHIQEEASKVWTSLEQAHPAPLLHQQSACIKY